jgi:hypothetical protein
MEQRMEQMLEAYLTEKYSGYFCELRIKETFLKESGVFRVAFSYYDSGEKTKIEDINVWDVVLWMYNKQIG